MPRVSAASQRGASLLSSGRDRSAELSPAHREGSPDPQRQSLRGTGLGLGKALCAGLCKGCGHRRGLRQERGQLCPDTVMMTGMGLLEGR